MIYKFIDNNGAEITVNSLSSLEALIDSETVKENTQVKAGLRGKWTSAINIDELKDLFNKKVEEIAEPEVPEEDIKSFITKEEPVEQEAIPEPVKVKENVVVEKMEVKINNETLENNPISSEKLNNDEEITDSYDDRFETITFIDAIKIGFKKYFDFNGRASRSEYWYFWLFGWAINIILLTLAFKVSKVFFWIEVIVFLAMIIPWISLTARRLHDANKTGWYQLAPAVAGALTRIPIPSIGIIFSVLNIILAIYLFVLYASRGTEGSNKYGNYPLKLKK
jgi:uncharacterized membrane protein YhaH (DUF805 family)